MKVAYQGVAGAYSEKAVHQLLGHEGVEATGYESFEAAFTAVTDGDVDTRIRPARSTSLSTLPTYIGTNHVGTNGATISDSEVFCSYLLSEFGCAIVPGSAFGIENSVRMSYATSLEVLGHSMDALENCLLSLVPQ
ncbi:hypothetical protein SPRG_21751 [Saprolegnia parasitica CBS 223.65]|uniref:Prephenate dehydratase domain-containing protein n=1 Tax=Saprolegnia parasitica (strain CBS 223.65) TaxID=695850 RepID=A0A067BMM5_SAPPC|nr:hypothetical protein SPRG_21751 [Saprolegnia parasitica CBS 223.65]KDO18005.1 hypothetical protein SPRG_21751 [Saprolegnia parasitica CBS 223.65]|eukprot:XP_012211289.1 hypothetical protein SPRG_21751 [Saprolegnia parasitica CBS 223.65]